MQNSAVKTIAALRIIRPALVLGDALEVWAGFQQRGNLVSIFRWMQCAGGIDQAPSWSEQRQQTAEQLSLQRQQSLDRFRCDASACIGMASEGTQA